jgi:amidohydrolase family protein
MRRLVRTLLLLVTMACGAAPPVAVPATPTPVPSPSASASVAPPEPDVRAQADAWRAAHLLVDLHEHIDDTPEYLAEAVRIHEAVGIGLAVNLSGGTVTPDKDGTSEFERGKALEDKLYPGHFLRYVNLDYTGWDDPGFGERAARQIERAFKLGAAGFKEFKRLGLFLRDKKGDLLKIDDPKLDPVWHECGLLGMPISIHVADPKAFWGAYDASNERWKELKDHPRWWFGDPMKYPPREALLDALDRVIARHPETTFVAVHFANNAEDLDWVDRALDRHPNMMADVAARIPEIGRHDPEAVRRVFEKHQDRILFATDFQVSERMTLGSGGSGPPPTEDDAIDFFRKHWRFFETRERDFPHMTPIQGDWTISGIGLDAAALRKIYFENARRLLARSLASQPGAPAR